MNTIDIKNKKDLHILKTEIEKILQTSSMNQIKTYKWKLVYPFLTEYKELHNLDSEKESIYVILNNPSKEEQFCYCGKKKKFCSLNNPYRKFCSSRCSALDPSTLQERKERISKTVKNNYKNLPEEEKQRRIKAYQDGCKNRTPKRNFRNEKKAIARNA